MTKARIADAIERRYGTALTIPDLPSLEALEALNARSVCRRYRRDPVLDDVVRLLCATALAAPTKSDLQQATIVRLADAAKRAAVCALLPGSPWLAEAPELFIFCADGWRLRRLFARAGKNFPNEHLDLFFNAVVDSAIVLATFLRAAAAVGLGCCPISAIRDHAAMIARLLALPQRVVPVAGLCLGWPAEEGRITPRLGLAATVHRDRYQEGDLADAIDGYDRRRAALRPYARQRSPQRWGEAAFYGWSEDKARQYAEPLRADFGAFVRAQGFRLE